MVCGSDGCIAIVCRSNDCIAMVCGLESCIAMVCGLARCNAMVCAMLLATNHCSPMVVFLDTLANRCNGLRCNCLCGCNGLFRALSITPLVCVAHCFPFSVIPTRDARFGEKAKSVVPSGIPPAPQESAGILPSGREIRPRNVPFGRSSHFSTPRPCNGPKKATVCVPLVGARVGHFLARAASKG